jgi:hypothetical protein
MTDNRKYHLRLLERFFHYDTVGSHSYEWPAGAIVTDPAKIALIEWRGVAADKIFEGEYKR